MLIVVIGNSGLLGPGREGAIVTEFTEGGFSVPLLNCFSTTVTAQLAETHGLTGRESATVWNIFRDTI